MKNKPFYLSDEHTRSFGGKTEGFESREEAIREKKHLKAYLQGKKYFTCGFESVPYHVALGIQVESDGSDELTQNTIRRPRMFEVKELWTPKNKK